MKALLRNLLGRKKYQKLFEKLHRISLKGLNYGHGANFSESGELFVFEHLSKKFNGTNPVIVFDVGANIGSYTNAIIKYFNKNLIVHAFEPSAKTYELFTQATKDKKNIVSNNLGCSDVEKKVTLYKNTNSSGLSSVYNRNLSHFGIGMNETEEVSLIRIDDYCIKNKLREIHFLKLDIEGHELSALKGAAKMLEQRKIHVIQFEFGGCNIDSRTYFQDFYYLLHDKYDLFRILKDGLLKLDEYLEINEVFITVNYLAILKRES